MPLYVRGQDHTRVPNILEAQKVPYLDDQKFPIKMKQLKNQGIERKVLVELQGVDG